MARYQPVIEAARRQRDRLAGRLWDLDDPAAGTGRRAAWNAGVTARWLEMPGAFLPLQIAAYCTVIRNKPSCLVVDSRMVTGRERYSPGILSEDDLVQERVTDPDYELSGWGGGEHPQKLIADGGTC